MLRTFLDKIFQNVQRYWQFYVLLVIGLFFLMRIHWSFRVLAAIVFVASAIVAILGALVGIMDAISGTQSEPQFLQRLVERAEAARKCIANLRSEAREIEAKIEELVNLPNREELPHGNQLGKRLILLDGYRIELSLRQAKIDFYARSLQTLTNLDDKWRQERRLNELQTDLEKLRAPAGPEEQQQMLALRAELAREEELLKSYKQLSKRLDKSESLENAQSLRKELEQLLN